MEIYEVKQKLLLIFIIFFVCSMTTTTSQCIKVGVKWTAKVRAIMSTFLHAFQLALWLQVDFQMESTWKTINQRHRNREMDQSWFDGSNWPGINCSNDLSFHTEIRCDLDLACEDFLCSVGKIFSRFSLSTDEVWMWNKFSLLFSLSLVHFRKIYCFMAQRVWELSGEMMCNFPWFG